MPRKKDGKYMFTLNYGAVMRAISFNLHNKDTPLPHRFTPELESLELCAGASSYPEGPSVPPPSA